MYLLNEVYRKIMSEIHFVGKTRYEDLTETAWLLIETVDFGACQKWEPASRIGDFVNFFNGFAKSPRVPR